MLLRENPKKLESVWIMQKDGKNQPSKGFGMHSFPDEVMRQTLGVLNRPAPTYRFEGAFYHVSTRETAGESFSTPREHEGFLSYLWDHKE